MGLATPPRGWVASGQLTVPCLSDCLAVERRIRFLGFPSLGHPDLRGGALFLIAVTDKPLSLVPRQTRSKSEDAMSQAMRAIVPE
ncbi:MAG: hypothetical protein HC781_22225 [Leptolyngbyaceae cyanobacterium CSU_1_4]|nr:hypothetical protein [Leptolyngbyaceae cyanobacterium CSU_1_4]